MTAKQEQRGRRVTDKMTGYDALRLRAIEPLSMLQKELAYLLLNDMQARGAALTYLHYVDNQGNLFPSARRDALREFKGLVSKVSSSELKEVLTDNISYLDEQGTIIQKSKELAAAVLVPPTILLVGLLEILATPFTYKRTKPHFSKYKSF